VPVLSSLLLLSTFSSQALTPKTTRNVIHGSAPYLTFDGGATRATDTEGLLGITLPSGAHIRPSSNYSSPSNPIELQRDNVRFSDIGMFVPTYTNSIALNTFVAPPYNYWRDDDGDGQAGGIYATGSLNLSIVDKNNQPVSRSELLTLCNAPYSVTLSSTGGTLSTRYGFPNSSYFGSRSVTYYIKPRGGAVCFVRPTLIYGGGGYAGPASIWNPTKGFLPQSTDPSRYDLNFPTTGANNLYFYLDIGGVDPSTLSWPPVSHGGITASMEFVPPKPPTEHHFFDEPGGVRVKLTGPYASDWQINETTPKQRVPTPALPARFELAGFDRHGHRVVTYGFVLKQWFVNRGNKQNTDQKWWCDHIGYSRPNVRDLTNTVRTAKPSISGAPPLSSGNHYQRRIGAGFLSEWGGLGYNGAGFVSTADFAVNDMPIEHLRGAFYVLASTGEIREANVRHQFFTVCASSLRP
jgi:hypothetical protein